MFSHYVIVLHAIKELLQTIVYVIYSSTLPVLCSGEACRANFAFVFEGEGENGSDGFQEVTVSLAHRYFWLIICYITKLDV